MINRTCHSVVTHTNTCTLFRVKTFCLVHGCSCKLLHLEVSLVTTMSTRVRDSRAKKYKEDFLEAGVMACPQFSVCRGTSALIVLSQEAEESS